MAVPGFLFLTAPALGWAPGGAFRALPQPAATVTFSPETAAVAVRARASPTSNALHTPFDESSNVSANFADRLSTPFAPPLNMQALSPSATSTLDSSALLSTALRWGMTQLPSDDVLLALASPHAYWLLREWRRRTFGDQIAAHALLSDARRQLLKQGYTEDALRGASVTVRTKGLFSTFHKAVVRRQKVHDVLALRVVLRKGLGDDSVFHAHEVVRRLWINQQGRQKDYVATPKSNGYRALHDTMVLPSGQAFEVQIRSRDMHLDAEYGTAAHRRYKGAIATLPLAVVSGYAQVSSASGRVRQQRVRWPLPAATALRIAS